MARRRNQLWGLRLTTLAFWALAAASAVYWGLRLTALSYEHASSTAVPQAFEPLTVNAQAITRLLGATSTVAASAVVPQHTPAPASRFVLKGILAGTTGSSGAALIAIDGQPAKPYRIGAEIAPGLMLQSLERRQARLGASMQEASTLVLDMARK